MTFNEEPLKTLRKWVSRILGKRLLPTETELVQQIIMGREIMFHPDFADMSYVESKTDFTQLDTDRRAKFERVRNIYVQTLTARHIHSQESWTDKIVHRLTEVD